MTFLHFSNFCRKKFPGLIQGIPGTYWMNVEVLPHDFCTLQPQKLYKNVQEPFCQAWKLFFAEIWKMLECHFWANVMLRQSRLQASRASPAQKSQGFRVVCFKNFSRATFFVFWPTLMVDIYLSYLPVKQIWWKSAVCGCADKVPIYLCKTPLNQPGWKCQKSMHGVAALCLEKPHHWRSFLYYKKLANNNKGKCQVCFCLARTLGLSKIGVTIA
jgi:hypothetical protein